MGFLVLTRKVGEEVIIRDENESPIIVKFLGVKGNQTQVGFEAPAYFKINRKEIDDKIKMGLPHNETRGNIK